MSSTISWGSSSTAGTVATCPPDHQRGPPLPWPTPWRSGAEPRDGTSTIAANRRARHDYSVLDTVEARIVLQSSEVKSLRLGQVQLADAYARVSGDELWLEGVHIARAVRQQCRRPRTPDRRRKLLPAEQIDRLSARVNQERLALVPLRLYFREGRAKVRKPASPRAAEGRQAPGGRPSAIPSRRWSGPRPSAQGHVSRASPRAGEQARL